MQIKAEAAAAAAVKAELDRQIESLRQQLADSQAAPPGTLAAHAATADGTGGAAAVAAPATMTVGSTARDSALLAAELRTTQVQLQHVMHERKAAQNLAEQHKSSAESLERHRDALHKTISELRTAKEVWQHSLTLNHFWCFYCFLFGGPLQGLRRPTQGKVNIFHCNMLVVG